MIATNPDRRLLALGAERAAALEHLEQISAGPADAALDDAILAVMDLETAIEAIPAMTPEGRVLKLEIFARQARIAVGDESGLNWSWAERELAILAEGARA